MNKGKLLIVLLMTLATVQVAPAEDAFRLTTVQGTMIGYEKEELTIQPSDAKARPVSVHVTGTSRLTIAGTQTRDGRTFMTQRDTDARALAEKQKISIIYAVLDNERILLSAVATAEDKK